MRLTIFGEDDRLIFAQAFGPSIPFTVESQTPDAATLGNVTRQLVVTGTDLAFDDAGRPVSGTVTGLTFRDGSDVTATLEDMSAPLTQVIAALELYAGTRDPFLWSQLLSAAPLEIVYPDGATGTGYAPHTLDTPVTLICGAADDSVMFGTFGRGPVTASLGAGNDSLRLGRDGAHTVYAGAGDDTVGGGELNDVIYTGHGENLAEGGGGHDLVVGGRDADLLYGLDGDDTLDGADGDDTLYGAGGGGDLYGDDGDDLIWAGIGDDFAEGGAGADTIGLGAGDDSALGFDGDDIVYGGVGNDTVIGNNGADLLWGGGDADTVDGGTGDDTLYGAAGDDSLAGSYGDDVLTGGAGPMSSLSPRSGSARTRSPISAWRRATGWSSPGCSRTSTAAPRPWWTRRSRWWTATRSWILARTT